MVESHPRTLAAVLQRLPFNMMGRNRLSNTVGSGRGGYFVNLKAVGWSDATRPESWNRFEKVNISRALQLRNEVTCALKDPPALVIGLSRSDGSSLGSTRSGMSLTRWRQREALDKASKQQVLSWE